MVKKLIIPIFFAWILMIRVGQAQNSTCSGSVSFCTGMELTYAAGTSGSAEPGPYYSCLSTQPAPAWFHMVVEDPGNITIYMHSEPLVDIDFVCWGPFSDAVTPCAGGLTASKVVDCSYSPNPTEFCDIPNAQDGKYYILMITNYSQMPTQITFEQSSGAGTLDCDLVTGLVPAFSAIPLQGSAPLTVHFTDRSIGHPVQFKWDFQDDGIYDAFDSVIDFTYEVPGIYSVKLWVQNEYTLDSVTYNDIIIVDTTTSIEEQYIKGNKCVNVFPNPAADRFYIEFSPDSEKPDALDILSMYGEIFFREDIQGSNINSMIINIEDIPSGIYFISISFSKKVINKKVIILPKI